MAGQSGTTFKKRQKELARQDRQREKIAKRLQRKLDRQAARAGGGPVDDGIESIESIESAPPPEH